MIFTILGADGFIGKHLRKFLLAAGHQVFTPRKGETERDVSLGHVIYSIGLTSDFRSRPFDTVRAHVSVLSDHLEHCSFDSFLYLSSTRVYSASIETAEDSPLQVSPVDPSDLYNISKLMGESLCLRLERPEIRVARLSNIVGPGDGSSGNFVSTICREAKAGHVILRTALSSEKDYLGVQDAVRAIEAVARSGESRIYNIASGRQTTNASWVDALSAQTGCKVSVASSAPVVKFPPIQIARITSEFGFACEDPVSMLPLILKDTL